MLYAFVLNNYKRLQEDIRSAMSAELSRMQREGLLCADRSSFTLRQPE